jgi:D-serine deaminase-like pyridoxal phosphate-dependent protein
MIIEPTFLIDKEKCEKNIDKILSKLESTGTQLRPHFKTHQNQEVANMFKDKGIRNITVSSLSMAEFFARDGWRDITVAFPINILEIDKINYLSSSIQLNILVESVETMTFLTEKCDHEIKYFIKIDVGTHRTGLYPEDHATISAIIETAYQNPNLKFHGFLAHAGHSYGARSSEEIREIYQKSIAPLIALKNQYQNDHPSIKISFGDTPTCSIVDNFEGVDEIRCGNFIYYDVMQAQIGSCSLDEVAVALACPVVAKHQDRGEIVIYGGGVHFSKDSIIDDKYGQIYGLMVEDYGSKWGNVVQGAYLKKVSQEHGILKVTPESFASYSIGDIVKILPIHSCMTANLMKENSQVVW